MNSNAKGNAQKTFAWRKTLISLVALLCVTAVDTFAQNVITGKVTDESGAPMPGVSIYIKNTTKGVLSELDGSYSITASKSETLVYSSMSYITEEVKVNGQKVIDVVLREDRNALEEAVVVGYGTQKKAHLTGSVAAVTQDEILKTTSSNVSQALVGKLPGIVSQQSLGQPGSDDVTMLVRGYSSYQGTKPLVLVDGVQQCAGRAVYFAAAKYGKAGRPPGVAPLVAVRGLVPQDKRLAGFRKFTLAGRMA